MATRKQEPDVADDATLDNVTSLGDAAATALAHVGDPSQEALDGMENVNKVKFVGMSMDSLAELPKIGTEMTFTVRARCVGVGDEEMNDGHIRHFAKMNVLSVVEQN